MIHIRSNLSKKHNKTLEVYFNTSIDRPRILKRLPSITNLDDVESMLVEDKGDHRHLTINILEYHDNSLTMMGAYTIDIVNVEHNYLTFNNNCSCDSREVYDVYVTYCKLQENYPMGYRDFIDYMFTTYNVQHVRKQFQGCKLKPVHSLKVRILRKPRKPLTPPSAPVTEVAPVWDSLFTLDKKARTTNAELYEVYCQRSGDKPLLSQVKFGKMLRKMYPSVMSYRFPADGEGKRPRGIQGITPTTP